MTVETLNLTLRQPLPEEAEATFALVIACETADLGEPLLEWDEHVADWAQNPPESRWVVATPDHQIAGYAILFTYGAGDNQMFSYVHPTYVEQGVGAMLVEAGERRSRVLMPASGPVYFRAYNIGNKTQAERLFTEHGFHIKTHIFLMEIVMTAPPPTPQWPEDLKLRLLRSPDEDRAAWQVVEDAFTEPGRAMRPFEPWEQRVFESPGFDPTMFYVVENRAGEIVAVIHCQHSERDTNVSQLAVRADYRRRGIGLNLLHTVFGEVWRRGGRVVVLSVDNQNPTNAISVYRQAGMQVKHHFIKWEKVLRAEE